MLPRKFHLTGKSRITRRNLGIVPKKFQYRNVPVGRRSPSAFSQHPCGIRIFEAIDHVTKNIVVLSKKVWPFIVAATRRGSMGKCFNKILTPKVQMASKPRARTSPVGGRGNLAKKGHGKVVISNVAIDS